MNNANNDFAARLKASWGIISNIAGIIGLISLLDDLRAWKSTIVWLIGLLTPSLAGLVHSVASFIHAVATVFQAIFHPPLDYLLSFLPFHVPFLVKDAIIIAIFVLMGRIRSEAQSNKAYVQYVKRPREARLTTALINAGFSSAIERQIVQSAAERRLMFFDRPIDRQSDFVQTHRAKSEAVWEGLRIKYGDSIDEIFRRELAARNAVDDREAIKRFAAAGEVSFVIVVLTAIFVGVFLVIDAVSAYL